MMEADGAAGRDLLAVGVMRADEIVAVRPEGGTYYATEHDLSELS